VLQNTEIADSTERANVQLKDQLDTSAKQRDAISADITVKEKQADSIVIDDGIKKTKMADELVSSGKQREKVSEEIKVVIAQEALVKEQKVQAESERLLVNARTVTEVAEQGVKDESKKKLQEEITLMKETKDLTKKKVAAEVAGIGISNSKSMKEAALIDKKITTEIAQADVLGNQKTLYTEQAKSFKAKHVRDTTKMYLDAFLMTAVNEVASNMNSPELKVGDTTIKGMLDPNSGGKIPVALGWDV
jgi:hypothetical protein